MVVDPFKEALSIFGLGDVTNRLNLTPVVRDAMAAAETIAVIILPHLTISFPTQFSRPEIKTGFAYHEIPVNTKQSLCDQFIQV